MWNGIMTRLYIQCTIPENMLIIKWDFIPVDSEEMLKGKSSKFVKHFSLLIPPSVCT